MVERSHRRSPFGRRDASVRTLGRGGQVAVLGLGRFGAALASELARLGYDVLGVDSDESRVQAYARSLTHTVSASINNVEVLRQLGIDEMSHVIVAVGSDLEASILATAALDELNVPNIWAKAVTTSHGRILQRVGAHHVVYPEHDMGHQVAHLIGGRMIDWFQLDEKFVMVETEAPSDVVGRSLADVGVRANYGVTVVCVKPAGGTFTYATADTVLEPGDILVVAGETAAAEAFARMT